MSVERCGYMQGELLSCNGRVLKVAVCVRGMCGAINEGDVM